MSNRLHVWLASAALFVGCGVAGRVETDSTKVLQNRNAVVVPTTDLMDITFSSPLAPDQIIEPSEQFLPWQGQHDPQPNWPHEPEQPGYLRQERLLEERRLVSRDGQDAGFAPFLLLAVILGLATAVAIRHGRCIGRGIHKTVRTLATAVIFAILLVVTAFVCMGLIAALIIFVAERALIEGIVHGADLVVRGANRLYAEAAFLLLPSRGPTWLANKDADAGEQPVMPPALVPPRARNVDKPLEDSRDGDEDEDATQATADEDQALADRLEWLQAELEAIKENLRRRSRRTS